MPRYKSGQRKPSQNKRLITTLSEVRATLTIAYQPPALNRCPRRTQSRNENQYSYPLCMDLLGEDGPGTADTVTHNQWYYQGRREKGSLGVVIIPKHGDYGPQCLLLLLPATLPNNPHHSPVHGESIHYNYQ